MSTNAHAPSETRARTAGSARLAHIDALRGLAVVFMIVLHTADGWLRPELKTGMPWAVIRTVGGQAAPLFLLLSGLGAGLLWSAHGPSSGGRARLARRGLEIMLAGYALRLGMWWIDSTTLLERVGAIGGGLLALGYAALYQALRDDSRLRAAALVLGGLVSAAAGTAYLAAESPRALHAVLRVDVLQTIGVALVLLAGLEPWLRGRSALTVLLGVPFALLVPVLSPHLPADLPASLAGYIAPYEAAPGGAAPGRFPLAPWMAYALFGAGLGQLWGKAAARGLGLVAALEWGVIGAALALGCCESVPAVASLLLREPWLTPLVRVGYRTGLGLVLGALCVALASPRTWGSQSLVALGRASLVVYCVHLEPAFGLMANPVRKQLDFRAWGLGCALLTATMIVLARFISLRASVGSKRPREHLPAATG